jgi:hypothetical protein
MEQMGARKRTVDFRRENRLGSRDHLITLHKPKARPDWMTDADFQSAPQTLTVREFKAGGKVPVHLDPSLIFRIRSSSPRRLGRPRLRIGRAYLPWTGEAVTASARLPNQKAPGQI